MKTIIAALAALLLGVTLVNGPAATADTSGFVRRSSALTRASSSGTENGLTM